MDLFSELIEKSIKHRAGEKELKALREACLEKLQQDNLEKLELPEGSICLQKKKPNPKKIDDPDILQLQDSLALAVERLAKENQRAIYEKQRKIYRLQREIKELLVNEDIRTLEEKLFEQTFKYLEKKQKTFMVVRTNARN